MRTTLPFGTPEPLPSYAPMQNPETVVFKDEHYQVAQWPTLVLAMWRSKPTLDRLVTVERAAEQASRTGQKFGVLVVIDASCDKPDPEFREKNSEMLNRFEHKLYGVANVLEGDGMRAVGLRFVLSGIMMTSKSRVPQKVFATADEALWWLHTLGSTPDPGEVQQVVEQAQYEWAHGLSNSTRPTAHSG
jgi:hypothetical protein